MPIIAANGINFNYHLDGPDGAPWITFSHSLASNLTMWDEQSALLSNDWRILRYDQRGHGGTAATKPPYTFDLLVQDRSVVMITEHQKVIPVFFDPVSNPFWVSIPVGLCRMGMEIPFKPSLLSQVVLP